MQCFFLVSGFNNFLVGGFKNCVLTMRGMIGWDDKWLVSICGIGENHQPAFLIAIWWCLQPYDFSSHMIKDPPKTSQNNQYMLEWNLKQWLFWHWLNLETRFSVVICSTSFVCRYDAPRLSIVWHIWKKVRAVLLRWELGWWFQFFRMVKLCWINNGLDMVNQQWLDMSQLYCTMVMVSICFNYITSLRSVQSYLGYSRRFATATARTASLGSRS